MTIPVGSRLGLYEVIAPLGAGGMGEVYRGRDTRLGREVALKVLPEALASDRERISRFEQEARAASALNHPNIVTIYEIGREGETAFIAMELIDGKTLREVTASGPMPVRKILTVAAQVAEGLAKAHAAGIVHRDLKPENVMVSKDGFVKILDFGLAKLVETESGGASAMPTLGHPETHPGTVMGTVGYMSPEQASGEKLDFRSDQFSLGSMLYEMTTGKKAFQRKTAAETLSAIIRDEPESIAKLRPELPLPVRWILERCLAKDPEERYGSTRDLARDLASVRDHISEVSSGAEALLASPGKSRRRVSLIVAGLGLLAAGAAASWAVSHGLRKETASAPSFKRLTFRKGALANARFGPDGQTVFYGARWDESGENRLYLTRPESPESKRLDFRFADILSVSRSGELAIQLDPAGTGTGTLATVPMAGGVLRKVVDGVPYGSADWAPDGKSLVVVREVNGKSRLEAPIGTMLIEGAELLWGPRYSPDGEWVAFFEGIRGETSSVSLIDRAGKRRRKLSTGWSNLTGAPCWAPDGREIWFTGSHAGEPGQPAALWAVSLRGQVRLVTRVPGSLELDDIAGGGRVLLAHHTSIVTLWGKTPGESKARDLSWLDASMPSDLSKDGKALVLTERGEGSGAARSVYLRGTDGGPAVLLGHGDARALSPDGQWVLVETDPGGGKPRHLTLLPTGSGEARALKDGLANFGWGAFSPDGKAIVFSAGAPGRPLRVYIRNVPDGAPRPISPDGYRLPDDSNPVSPDGRFVVARAERGYALLPLGGGPARPIPGLSEDDLVIQWTADSRSLYAYRSGASPRVDLLNVENGQRRLWKDLPGRDVYYVRVTPDGGSYLYWAPTVFSELYIVEGLR